MIELVKECLLFFGQHTLFVGVQLLGHAVLLFLYLGDARLFLLSLAHQLEDLLRLLCALPLNLLQLGSDLGEMDFHALAVLVSKLS